MNTMLSKTVLPLVLLVLLVCRLNGQDEPAGGAEAQFARAFFLQLHEHDLAGAAAIYEKVANDAATPEKLRDEARSRLAGVREDLAAVDFAHLMPPDVMGYAELVEPGEHIGRILKMLGLIDPPSADKATDRPIRLGDGLYLPADFAVSPALVAELKKLRGAAAGVTAIDDHGRPAGLAVIHPGDCDLVRGLIETAVQVLEPGEPIEGFKTYHVPDIGWVMLTKRLVLVSDARAQLVAALERLRNPQAESLASRSEFKRVRGDKSAAVFVFVDGQQAVKRFGSQLGGREAAMVKALLDLEHLESLAATLSTTDEGIQLRAQLNLTPGHHNMIYALLRTAAISKRLLEQVPKGAAGVVVLGLNPPSAAPAPPQDGQIPPSVTGMDIGREFFGNIDELAAFALPAAAQSAAAFPEMAVVVVVKDPAKSEVLWNQVLMLASLLGARMTEPASEVTIEGKPGHAYHFEGLPPIAVVRADQRGLVIGTQTAVAASLRAVADKQSIIQDEAFAPLVGRLTPTTSKAVMVDVGRALEIVASMSKGRNAQELRDAARVAGDLKVSLVTDEAPNQFTIEVEATGLPKFRSLLPLLSPQARRGLSAGK